MLADTVVVVVEIAVLVVFEIAILVVGVSVVVVVLLLVVDVIGVFVVIGLEVSDAPLQAEAQNVRKTKTKILFTVGLLNFVLFNGWYPSKFKLVVKLDQNLLE